MKIKTYLQSTLLSGLVCLLAACSGQNNEPEAAQAAHDKPIQHLHLEDITSLNEAVRVFAKEVAFIQGQTELTPQVLHDIHMSTYSLEKAVAYYVENSEGARKELAEQIAEVTEQIHLASERNQPEATAKHIEQLKALTEQFQTTL